MTAEELKAIEKLTSAVKELDYTVTALLWATVANNVGNNQQKAILFEDSLRNTQKLVNSLTNGIREASQKIEKEA
jgi:methyl-accepting chemotaxis protein